MPDTDTYLPPTTTSSVSTIAPVTGTIVNPDPLPELPVTSEITVTPTTVTPGTTVTPITMTPTTVTTTTISSCSVVTSSSTSTQQQIANSKSNVVVLTFSFLTVIYATSLATTFNFRNHTTSSVLFSTLELVVTMPVYTTSVIDILVTNIHTYFYVYELVICTAVPVETLVPSGPQITTHHTDFPTTPHTASHKDSPTNSPHPPAPTSSVSTVIMTVPANPDVCILANSGSFLSLSWLVTLLPFLLF